jgi:hypothetical protein
MGYDPRGLRAVVLASCGWALVSLIGCASRDVPPAPPHQPTFEQRCADPATVKCVGFDTPAEVDRFVYPVGGVNTKRG